MKIFTLNGPKVAYTFFSIFCAAVILWFGFLRGGDNAYPTSGGYQFQNTVYVAIVIDDFGNGKDGTREFLYMDIPFTGIVMAEQAFSAEEERLLRDAGKDVILNTQSQRNVELLESLEIDISRLIYLDKTQNVKRIEENFLKTAEIARDKGFAIAIGRVGQNGGRTTAKAMQNIRDTYADMSVEFVTISQLIELLNKM
ncbi:MAG: divergent polysaccharide deacetylase family protein [Defluviitaleaceae bacterium]|nr:divergent polysaccharide deacetylase family protein [Defluviitaleaceae bacterium]